MGHGAPPDSMAEQTAATSVQPKVAAACRTRLDHVAKKKISFQRGASPVPLSSSSKGSCAIFHAIGRVLNSNAGLQLEIGDDDSFEEQTAESSGSTRRLIGVEDMRRDDAALFVIQGEPLTDFSSREDSDRESAALLRAFGAELFAAGAEAVLVLPSLNAPVAEAALRDIAKRLASSRPPGLHRMLDAVARARKTIREWPAPPKIAATAHDLKWFRHDQLEAALDICLFARTDFTPLLTETTTKA